MKSNLTVILIFITVNLSGQFKFGVTTGLNFSGSKHNSEYMTPSESDVLNSNRSSFVINFMPELYINKNSSLIMKLGFSKNRDSYLYYFESIYSPQYTQNNNIEHNLTRRLKVKTQFVRFSLLHQSYINLDKEKVFLTFNLGGGFAFVNKTNIDFYEADYLGSEIRKDKSTSLSINIARQSNEFFIESSLGLEFLLSPKLRLRMEGTYLAGLDDLNPYRNPVASDLYDKYNLVNTSHRAYFTRSMSFNIGISYFLKSKKPSQQKLKGLH